MLIASRKSRQWQLEDELLDIWDHFEDEWDAANLCAPFMAFEHTVWAVVGSETQQLTSPVFTFDGDDKKSWEHPTRMVWSSLTEMFSVDLSDWDNWFV